MALRLADAKEFNRLVANLRTSQKRLARPWKNIFKSNQSNQETVETFLTERHETNRKRNWESGKKRYVATVWLCGSLTTKNLIVWLKS